MATGKGTTIVVVGLLALALLLFGRPPQAADGGNVLRITSESPPDFLDPAMSYQIVSWQTMLNVYNGLLTYPKEAGPGGAELVPDLATAMPKVSDGGRTYSFTMRRGVRWGPPLQREVLPSDLKWAIERNLRMASPGSSFYTNVVGVKEFSEKQAQEVSGITVDDSARTISFRLTRPDATFLNVLALPFSFAVPKGTPPKDQSLTGFVPATGPYMFVEYDPQRRIVLKRNPNFRSWTKHTPAGYVDGIEIQLGVSQDNAVARIKRGKADYMFGSIPRSQLPLLLKDEGLKPQIHIQHAPSTAYIFMNTRLPPFNDRRARQAINWAIDRRAMVKLTGGLGTPSETILPPSMPGYRDHSFYPHQDIGKARQLLAEAGVRPGRIDIWCRTNEPNPQLAQYLQGVLAQLGFQPSVKCVDGSSYMSLVGNSRTKALIGLGNWSQDFPEGSNFIDVLLNGNHITPGRSNNLAFYSGADEQIEAANRLLDLKARAKAWGDLDAQIVEDGAWAPFMHGTDFVFTSKRLRNYVHSPVYSMLFMQVQLEGEAGDEPASEGAAARHVVPGGGTAHDDGVPVEPRVFRGVQGAV